MNDLIIPIFNKDSQDEHILFPLKENLYFINQKDINIYKVELQTQKISILTQQLPIPLTTNSITFNDEEVYLLVNNVIIQVYEHQLLVNKLEFVPQQDQLILLKDGPYVKNVDNQFICIKNNTKVYSPTSFNLQTTSNKNFGSIGYILGSRLYEIKNYKIHHICDIKDTFKSMIYFYNYLVLIGEKTIVINLKSNQVFESQIFLPKSNYILISDYLVTSKFFIFGYFILGSILYSGTTKLCLRTYPSLRNGLEYSLIDHQLGFQSSGLVAFIRNQYPCFTELGNCQSYYQLEKDKIVIRNLDFQYNFGYCPSYENVDQQTYIFTQIGQFYQFSSNKCTQIVTPQSPCGRIFSTLKQIDQDRLILCGGVSVDYGFGISSTQKVAIQVLDDIWIYYISQKKWVQQDILMPKIHSHQIIVTKSYLYLLWGSTDAQLTVNDKIYRIKYNQHNLTQIDESNMINQPSGRFGHTVVQHKNYCFIMSGSYGIGVEQPQDIQILDIHKRKFYTAKIKFVYGGCYQNYILINRYIVSTRSKFDFSKILDKFVHAKDSQREINKSDLTKSSLDSQQQYSIKNNRLTKSIFSSKSKSQFKDDISNLSNDSFSSINSGVSGITEKINNKTKGGNKKSLELIIGSLTQADLIQRYQQILQSINIQWPEKIILTPQFAEFYFQHEKSLKQHISTITFEQKAQLFHEILSQIYTLHSLGMKIPAYLTDMIYIENSNAQIRISGQYSLDYVQEIENLKNLLFEDENIQNYNILITSNIIPCYQFEDILDVSRQIRKKAIQDNTLIVIMHEGEPKSLKQFFRDQFVDLFQLEMRHFLKLLKPFLSNFVVFPSTKRLPAVFYHIMIDENNLNEYKFIQYLYQSFGQQFCKFTDILKISYEYGINQDDIKRLNWLVGLSSLNWRNVVQFKNNHDKNLILKYLDLLPNFAVNWIFSLIGSYQIISGENTIIEDKVLIVSVQDDDDQFIGKIVYEIAKRTVI